MGCGELRDSTSRRSSAHLPPNLSGSGCGVRPGHQRCPAAGPATLRVAEAPHPFTAPFCSIRPRRAPKGSQKPNQQISTKHEQRFSLILSGSGCALPGWAEGPARRPGGSTNRKSTSYSSAQYSVKTYSGFHARKTNTAQLTAPIQALCSVRHGSKTVAGFRARRTARPKAKPSSPSSVRLTAAPLALRHVFARRGNLVKTRQRILTRFPS